MNQLRVFGGRPGTRLLELATRCGRVWVVNVRCVDVVDEFSRSVTSLDSELCAELSMP